MTMTSHSVMGLSAGGFHRINYYQWGDPDNDRVLLCVHGLTRNGRDFDWLAQALASDYRVLCPDVVGRGKSGWLTQKTAYSYPQYLADMNAVIARSGAARIDWVGTSMGGLIGMMLAAQPDSPIARLVVNDVGPFIPKTALERIGAYLGQQIRFSSMDKMIEYVRVIAAPFGQLTDEQWRHLTVHSASQRDDGEFVFNYDPGIAEPFKADLTDVDLWPLWDAVRCPTLLLRGADSDILRAEDAQAMTGRGPKAQLVDFPGVGHAPALMDEHQIAVIRDWLGS